MTQPSHSYGGLNWRAILWWLFFSVCWTLVLFGFLTRGYYFLLCAFAGSLLGYLTLCALDIWQAYRHQRALREECRRKREEGARGE